MKEKKSGLFSNTVVIFVITLVSVVLLAVVYQITKEPIAKAQEDAKIKIYSSVFTGAVSFEKIENTQSLLSGAAPALSKADLSDCTVDEALYAKSESGETAGYVISAVSPNGYGGDVKIAVGISRDGVLTGFDVVSNSETAGLGSKCTDEEFTSQFKNKRAEMIKYTKTGASAPDEIDAISGATRTTNAAVQAVNTAIIFYNENFGAKAAKGE